MCIRSWRDLLPLSAWSELLGGTITRSSLRKLCELRRVAADMVPRGARTHKDMHANLNARIAIYTTQRDTVHRSLMNATKRGATRSAKAETPSRSGLVPCQLLFTFGPFE
jgi:hypothetical protein